MKLTHVLQLTSNQTLDVLKKSIKQVVDEAPGYIKNIKDEQKQIVYGKLSNLNKLYMRTIGLDEVKLYQDRVTALQDQLLKTQEKRREVGRQLAEIRQKSAELQDEIHKTKRQDDLEKFLDLMKEETDVLKLEKSTYQIFQDYDQTERETFTAFANAIRDSHEKQRAQLEYTKYFGVVLSIAGSFLTFVYSTVKKHDLKVFIDDKLETINSNLHVHFTNLTEIENNRLQKLDEIKKNAQYDVIKVADVRISSEHKPENVFVNSQPKITDLPENKGPLVAENTNGVSPEPIPDPSQDKFLYLKVVGGLCLALAVLQMISNSS